MTANFGDYHLLLIFIIGVGAIFVSTEVGRWLGTRAGDRGGEQVRTLEGAVAGFIRTSQQPMIDTAASIAKY